MSLPSQIIVAVVALLGVEPTTSTNLESTIGMEQAYYLRHSGRPLEAKPLDDDAPIILRIGEVTPVDPEKPTGPQIYELRYIGTRAGQHDLRDYLTATAGGPLEGVEPMPVTVTELLPPDHKGDLVPLAAPKSPSFWSYRTLCLAAIALWLFPLVSYVSNRLRRRQKISSAVTMPAESLEAQLQAMATTAAERELTPTEQAQLERLLLRYWRECLELRKLPPEQLLGELSRNVRTSELLRQLEGWLYRRPGTAEIDVESLLAPYRHLEAAGPARSAS